MVVQLVLRIVDHHILKYSLHVAHALAEIVTSSVKDHFHNFTTLFSSATATPTF